MSTVILYCMAFGALLGGVDCILGNRFGLGKPFEEAFQLLGSLAISMAGILCLAPVLSQWLGALIVPVFTALKLDPGMAGAILAIDMGGYPMAMELAKDPAVGRFAGIVVSAIFGCTVVFTVPVGMGIMAEKDRRYFTNGILLGLGVMPLGLVSGGIFCGLPFWGLLWNCMPVILLSVAMILGLLLRPKGMIRLFRIFAKTIRILAVAGLTLGAIQYMTGLELVRGLVTLEEAMEVVCSIGIVQLGSLPLAQLLQRLLKKPFVRIAKHTGLNGSSITGLLLGMVSVVPTLALFPQMDDRGKVVCGAFLVSAASAFAAHLGYAVSVESETVMPMLCAKLTGGILAVILALAVTKKKNRVHQDNVM